MATRSRTVGGRVYCQGDMGEWAYASCVAEHLADSVPCITPRLLAAIAGVDQRVASKVLLRRHDVLGLRKHGTVYCGCRGSWDKMPEPAEPARVTIADLARLAAVYAAVCRDGSLDAAAETLSALALRLGLSIDNPRRVIVNEVARTGYVGWGPGRRLVAR